MVQLGTGRWGPRNVFGADDWSLLCGRARTDKVETHDRLTALKPIYIWGAYREPKYLDAFVMLTRSTSWVTVPLPAGLLEESNFFVARLRVI